MKQPRYKISRYIADSTLNKGASKQFIKEIAAYLLEERRVSELDSLVRDVQADWANAGRVEVIAASAFPLGIGVKADIIKTIRQIFPDAKTINISEIIEPEVIGGVRLSMADKQLDLSLEAKLTKFKNLTHAGKDL